MHKALVLFLLLNFLPSAGSAELRIASLEAAPVSFPTGDEALIFHDEFDAPPAQNPVYFEVTSEGQEGFVQVKDCGLEGGSMLATFEKGQVTAGTLKLLFGRN